MTLLVILLSALLWLGLLFVPWRPFSVRESLNSSSESFDDLADVVALVPARNEETRIQRTLTSLAEQGTQLKIVVVDDESTDRTADVIASLNLLNLVLIRGTMMPEGWTGKVWAQSQAEGELDRPFTLLMDADVELSPGLLGTLRKKLREDGLGLVSLMVELPMKTVWEKLLIPAFVYFFKLLYPFSLASATDSKIAAAAGGCILIETERLRRIGGFGRLRNALIDDCALAQLIKQHGACIWVGLTRSARSHRRYAGIFDVWDMVARTAFTQLGYSCAMLAACTALMALAFVAPVVGIMLGAPQAAACGVIALGAMTVSYLPTIRYYQRHPAWACTLPLAGVLFLAMTWTSAFQYWWGDGAVWRGRMYGPQRGTNS